MGGAGGGSGSDPSRVNYGFGMADLDPLYSCDNVF
jgi:hypothetical protein